MTERINLTMKKWSTGIINTLTLTTHIVSNA